MKNNMIKVFCGFACLVFAQSSMGMLEIRSANRNDIDTAQIFEAGLNNEENPNVNGVTRSDETSTNGEEESLDETQNGTFNQTVNIPPRDNNLFTPTYTCYYNPDLERRKAINRVNGAQAALNRFNTNFNARFGTQPRNLSALELQEWKNEKFQAEDIRKRLGNELFKAQEAASKYQDEEETQDQDQTQFNQISTDFHAELLNRFNNQK